ncbi:hypothetical protein C0991_003641 [Blastosporella zonata]|nr:hypothetical protein C0991_003641 [Blastosporella zonata]
MPALTSDISIEIFEDVKQLPAAAWKVLEDHPRPANIISPQALKARWEGSGPRKDKTTDLWIVCSTDSIIEFILSATEGSMGSYPIFIFTPLPSHCLSDDYIRPCIQSMVVALAAAAPISRVYSIFSLEPVAMIFAKEWTKRTGIELADDPVYYEAKLSYCTIDTLDKRSFTMDASRGYQLRPAVHEDIESIGELCYFFASDSVRLLSYSTIFAKELTFHVLQQPFTLTKARAELEASILVEKKQVWVHEAKGSGGGKEIASIVAFTRNSDRVATISKVCTNERWQRQGCAERLVRKVCDQ